MNVRRLESLLLLVAARVPDELRSRRSVIRRQLSSGRQWFAQHRQLAHPELDAAAARRRQRRVWK